MRCCKTYIFYIAIQVNCALCLDMCRCVAHIMHTYVWRRQRLRTHSLGIEFRHVRARRKDALRKAAPQRETRNRYAKLAGYARLMGKWNSGWLLLAGEWDANATASAENAYKWPTEWMLWHNGNCWFCHVVYLIYMYMFLRRAVCVTSIMVRVAWDEGRFGAVYMVRRWYMFSVYIHVIRETQNGARWVFERDVWTVMSNARSGVLLFCFFFVLITTWSGDFFAFCAWIQSRGVWLSQNMYMYILLCVLYTIDIYILTRAFRSSTYAICGICCQNRGWRVTIYCCVRRLTTTCLFVCDGVVFFKASFLSWYQLSRAVDLIYGRVVGEMV